MSAEAMGVEAARDVVRKLHSLWPGVKFAEHWGEDSMREFGRRVSALPVSREQAFACLTELRMGRSSFPDVAAVWDALRKLGREQRAKTITAEGRHPQHRWKETPEQAAAVERGRREAVEFVNSLSDADLAAIAEATAGRVETFWPVMARDLRLPVAHLRAKLARSVHLRGLLHAAHRMACREAAGGRRSA